MEVLPSFLCSLKLVIAPWIHHQKMQQKARLLHLKELILDYYTDHDTSMNADLDAVTIKALQSKKEELLCKEEVIWCLKSWALWNTQGDKNTTFFHSFADMRQKIMRCGRLKIFEAGRFPHSLVLKRLLLNIFGLSLQNLLLIMLQHRWSHTMYA